MRQFLWLGLASLVLVGCSQASDEKSSKEDLKTFDVEGPSTSAPPRAPGIAPTAAPGVAFSYRYGFRLPDTNISAAQEAHALACEKLGPVRCRITGMTYVLDSRDRVEGSLNLSIDPTLARAFGRGAITTVEKQEGHLRYADITGEDKNPVMDEAARQQKSAATEIVKLEADLRTARTANERVQLREQIGQLRAEAEQAKQTSIAAEAGIQRTPMSFLYAGSGASGRGFAENPAREAWYLFTDSLATLVAFLLKGLALVLPWAVFFALLVALYRSRPGRGVRAAFLKPRVPDRSQVDQTRVD